MKKRIVALLLATALVTALFAVPALAGAATITARPTDDLQTLIDGASPGDVIDLDSNTFSVAVLNVDKKVTLQNGTITMIAQTPPLGATNTDFTSTINVSAAGVTLKSLTINGFTGQWDGDHNSFGCNTVTVNSGADNVTITDCKITLGGAYPNDDDVNNPNTAYGIAIGTSGSPGPANLTITNNTISTPGASETNPVDTLVYTQKCTNVTISGNTFSGSFYRAIAMDSVTGTVTNNTFSGGVNQWSTSVMFISLQNNYSSAPAVSVSGNTFNGDPSQAQQYAVVMRDPSWLTSFDDNMLNNFQVVTNDGVSQIAPIIVLGGPAGFDSPSGNNIDFASTAYVSPNWLTYFDACDTIIVKTTNSATNAPYAGISYQLKDSTGNVIATGVSDPDGVLIFGHLPYHATKDTVYEVVPTSAIASVTPASQKVTFLVNAPATIIQTVEFAGKAIPPKPPVPVPDLYTVTLDANGGTVSPQSVTQDAEGAAVKLPTPTRKGYTFDGWFTDEGEKVTSPYTPTADITLTAQWTEVVVEKIVTPPSTLLKTGDNAKLVSAIGVATLLLVAGTAATLMVLRRRRGQA
ncbi:MAG: InlB B-repeat-containing protein [Coriobacteriia bacterium]|nr:InlB B-repeat-containing protein [Coriobacteriia bacterium]